MMNFMSEIGVRCQVFTKKPLKERSGQKLARLFRSSACLKEDVYLTYLCDLSYSSISLSSSGANGGADANTSTSGSFPLFSSE